MSLAERIKDSRRIKGYTQRDLAQLLNVKPVTVSAWEVGRNEPSLSMIRKLSEVLNVSFDYLTGSSQDNKRLDDLTENQKLIAYSIDPNISNEDRNDIIELVKLAMKGRRRT